MFENARRGRQARNFTTNVPKILDRKSSSEQIFFRKLTLSAPVIFHICSFLWYKPRNLPHRWATSFSWYGCGSPHPIIFASNSFRQSSIFQSCMGKFTWALSGTVSVLNISSSLSRRIFGAHSRVNLPFTLVTLWFEADSNELEKYVLPIFKILPLTVQPSKPRLCHKERSHPSQFRSRRHKCSSHTRGFQWPSM